jgi:K+-dependent Na+/Ca+ exchanger-like protein
MHPIIAFGVLLLSFYFLSRIVDDFFIESLDNISHTLKLPPSVSGATFMAAGTSAPELASTLFGLILLTGPDSNPAEGLGTVVGSAIFQILVVIGFAALVKTAYLNWKPVIRDGVTYAVSIIILIIVLIDGNITQLEAGLMVLSYLGYLIMLAVWSKFVDESDEPDPMDTVQENVKEEEKQNPLFKPFNILLKPVNFVFDLIPDCSKDKRWTIPIFLFSLASIAFASYWMVLGAKEFALGIGIPFSIVSLTILAGGTSVPELIGSSIVSKQGRGDMAISNAIGSNTFDILMSLGLPLLIYTTWKGDLMNVNAENITSSIILLFFTVLMVLGLLISQKFKAGKIFGGVLIFTYVIYVIAAYVGVLG